MPKGLDYLINLKDGDFGGVKKAKDEVEGLDSTVEKATESFGGMGSAIIGAGAALAGSFALDGLLDMVDDITQVRGQFQGFENLLKNQLGPAGEQVFADIKKFSAETPFEVDKLTESFIKLQGSGFDPTMQKMGLLGDFAAAKMKGVDQLTEAIIDAQTGEFERLKEFGVRAAKSGDNVTFTYNGMAKTMKFSQKNTEEYLLSLGKLEGVSGSMAAMSDTFIGKQSNLNDQITQFKDRLGKDLEPVLGKFIDMKGEAIVMLQHGVDWFKANQGAIGDVATVLGVAAGAYGLYQGVMLGANAVMAISNAYMAVSNGLAAVSIYYDVARAEGMGVLTAAQWALNVAMEANPIGLIVTGVGLLIGGLVLAYKHSETFRAVIAGIGEVASTLVPVFKGLGEVILGAFTMNPIMIAKGFADAYDGVKKVIDNGGITETFKKGYQGSLDESRKDELAEAAKATSLSAPMKVPAGKKPAQATPPSTAGKDSTTMAGGRSVRNVQVTIGKLVERLVIQNTNVAGLNNADIKRQITELIVGSVHDSELALGSQ